MHTKQQKFIHKYTTAIGDNRAFVNFTKLETLWFNTGTLCNLSCKGCYIESSPINNKLLYLSLKDVEEYLRQIKMYKLSCNTIGFTGGEPFMNKDIIPIINLCIKENYNILVLTNAMQPMLNKIRRFIPNLGSLDISPVILLILIWFLQTCMYLYLKPIIFN